MNRGRAALTAWNRSQGLGFNEAPIHESGKDSTINRSYWARPRLQ